MLIEYIQRDFSEQSLATIRTANEILDAYRRDGYVLTLRQLYYQFVSRDLIPNNDRSYKNLGTLISNARLAGLVSWRDIEDRNRGLLAYGFEESQERIIAGLENQLLVDRWARQAYYIEIWVEKDALSSVVERAAAPFYLPHLACKGYLSQSEAWRAGVRFKEAAEDGRLPILIHLGDHDPSGIDMTRDNGERLEMFAEQGVEVRRIALNMDQVEEHNPPPNPAKVTDSRAAGYIAKYGSSSWELDALEPSLIVELIQAEIKPLIDMDAWRAAEIEEDDKRKRLAKIAENWEMVAEFLDDL